MRSFRTKASVSPAHPKSTPERDDYLYRTHKIVLDPTPEQERLLTHTADYSVLCRPAKPAQSDAWLSIGKQSTVSFLPSSRISICH